MPFDHRRRPPLELWGGVECTVNRVGDAYFDQLERNGHDSRGEDLDRFAALGLRALRYPVLWERVAPDGLDRADWRWPDERLGRLRELGIRPIVGLIHHGSGPRHTSLVDPGFVDGLATFARVAAERYPWVEDWTPVNEPMTTARFSALYGHWYPHGRDDLMWARAVLTQCRAVAAAMRAVRSVIPAARLVQTEDLGKTWSTPALRYQAEFENERRWLSFDLLCGRVDRHHWMWQHLRRLGVREEELTPFLEEPCPPDIVGVNHYLTSERFLDERLERYPSQTHGGNGRIAYADVEAVRVLASGMAGPEGLLREAQERFELPIAVTEAHLGCTREEQMRWFKQVWDAANTLRAEGADVRAVTAWSLLGAFDWNSLVTRAEGHYEPGVFDLRAPQPRPTALAHTLRDLAVGREPDHPVLGVPGWWLRPHRLLYEPVHHEEDEAPPRPTATEESVTAGQLAPPVLIVGGGEALGTAFARVCEARGISCRLLDGPELDGSDPVAVEAALDEHRPWAVVDATGVDQAERGGRGHIVRRTTLADACARREIAQLAFSSALVFDGTKATPYVESDPVTPLTALGRLEADAETRTLGTHPGALVIRRGPLFGPWDTDNFAMATLRALAAGEPFPIADDAVVSPTYIPDLVHACLDLLIDGERGIWHLANGEVTTWADFAHRLAILAGLDGRQVVPRPSASLGLGTLPPGFWALRSERGWIMPALEDALGRFVQERDAEFARSEPGEPGDAGFPGAPLEFEPRAGKKLVRRAS